MSIPKIIHYCWYGKGPKPECFEKCYASWKKYAPDYEIIEWNESNTNMEENEFMRQAYAAKKYAFVSDISRLRAVYDFGGIYLDTDVELTSAVSELLNHSGFFFFDSFGKIGTGFGFGAEQYNPLIKKMLDDYNLYSFSVENHKKLLSTYPNTQSAKSFFEHLEDENMTQHIGNYAFFSSHDYSRYAIHHYTATWRNPEDFYAEKFKKKKWPFRRYMKYLRSPNIFHFFQKYKLKRINRLYSFFVYDFAIYGFKYYAYKLIKKSNDY